MTDITPPVGAGSDDKLTARRDETPVPAGRRHARKHPAARARIAAAGIGVGAMVGLASHMDVTFSRAQAAVASPLSPVARAHRALVAANAVTAARADAAVQSRRPIVLTVHAVVRTVNAPSTSGYVGSGYSASAAAPAAAPAPAPAAPVASTSGSHP